jgi:HEPN domain-containing protein
MDFITKKWIAFAQEDLQNADILFKNKSYKGVIYYCHQAIEKSIKAIINEQGKRIPKTHDLPCLLEISGIKLPDLIVEIIEELNPYYNPSRYPDTAIGSILKYDRLTTASFIKQSQEIIKWLKNELIQLK